MGDFEIIDMIVDRREESSPETIGELIGRYALNAFIAQQHREKLKIQTKAIRETCKNCSNPRILSLASGSSRDFEPAVDKLRESRTEILLVDFEDEALKSSIERLSEISGQIETLLIDIRKLKTFFKKLNKREEFDLIIAGGLFDYLPDKMAKVIIKKVLKDFLCDGGIFLFSNIDQGNPYRAWIEIMGNWELIERSREDVEKLFASIDLAGYQITKEPTGLCWITRLKK